MQSTIENYRKPIFKTNLFWVAVLTFLIAVFGLRYLGTEMQMHNGLEIVYLVPASMMVYSFVRLVTQQMRMRRLLRQSEPSKEQLQLLSIVGSYAYEVFWFMAAAIFTLAMGITILLQLPHH